MSVELLMLRSVLTWGEADIPDRLVVACEGVHEVAGGHVKDRHGAIHDAARQALSVRAEGHAQHKLLPLVLLIRLQQSSCPLGWQ